MGFDIISELPDEMYAGMFIEYIVKPVAGIPMKWVSEITQLRPPYFFIDEQRIGPYALWHHQHHFQKLENGTKVTDIVNYALPFGSLGRLAHNVFVKNQLISIFDYREQVLEQYFNQSNLIEV